MMEDLFKLMDYFFIGALVFILCFGGYFIWQSEIDRTFFLEDNTIVSCGYSERFDCGWSMRKCDDGFKYSCQKNVKILEESG